jgi:polar amino acid transport system permease protein
MMVVVGWLDEFLWGSFVILQIFFMSTIMAVIWGLLGAAAKLSNNRIAKAVATGFTTVFRGTPELLVLLIVYFGSAAPLTMIAQIFDPEVKFVDLPPLFAAAFAVSLIIGAYATETFRGAFQGVDPGTVEAARSLGISAPKTFFYVRLPQMWRLALPGFGNHMLSLVKDTALVSVIGVEEILFTADIATSVTQEPFTFYMVAALIYLCFTTVIMYGVQLMELRANRHLEGGR